MKTQNKIVSGALILLVANLLVKIVGMGFKIPLHHLLCDEGMGYFNAAYNLYVWFFMISTTGLPVAISTMVAEENARGNAGGVRAIFRVALVLFFAIGVVGSGAMFLFANGFANSAGMSKAVYSIYALAPTLFFACVSGAFRGYFQGKEQMLPTALSQVAEAVGKLVLGILFACYAIAQGYDLPIISAYAVGGVTVGSFLSVLLLFVWKLCERAPACVCVAKVPQTAVSARLWRLVQVALPVTLASSVLSLTSVLDTVLVPARLQTGAGYAPQAAVALYGNYTTLAVPLFHAPTVLLYPITCAVLPALSAAASRGDAKEVHALRQGSMRAVAICTLPATLGLALFSKPILALLYRAESAELAAPQLSVLAVGLFFYGTVAITNAFLQAAGKTWYLLPSAVLGVAVKLVATYLLAGDTRFALYGAPVGTVLCYLTIALCNLYVVRRHVGTLPPAHALYARPLLASVICAVCGAGCYLALAGTSLPAAVVTLGAIAVAAVGYLVALLLLGALSTEDLEHIPGGQILARFLPANQDENESLSKADVVLQKGLTHERTSQTTRRKKTV